jgi:hypothetical protein
MRLVLRPKSRGGGTGGVADIDRRYGETPEKIDPIYRIRGNGAGAAQAEARLAIGRAMGDG